MPPFTERAIMRALGMNATWRRTSDQARVSSNPCHPGRRQSATTPAAWLSDACSGHPPFLRWHSTVGTVCNVSHAPNAAHCRHLQAIMPTTAVRMPCPQLRRSRATGPSAAQAGPTNGATAVAPLTESPVSGIASDVSQLVGDTPMVFLQRVTQVRAAVARWYRGD